MAAGYEVHLNFSPVVVYEGWQAEYDELLRQVDDSIGEASKKQLAAEVIFLTHNERPARLGVQAAPGPAHALLPRAIRVLTPAAVGCQPP